MNTDINYENTLSSITNLECYNNELETEVREAMFEINVDHMDVILVYMIS